ncbi:hypothetical protein Y1Q_0002491 [Alligator mississippiensis]|uniref:Uncharacterized protein n=1 Tax=Alligator mississippiensis TaxID=8496 RepID=A0A151NBJ3_ALLMI|nr:hypothetical protein Y1Q_0002491 [Alligator mississippiensis]
MLVKRFHLDEAVCRDGKPLHFSLHTRIRMMKNWQSGIPGTLNLGGRPSSETKDWKSYWERLRSFPYPDLPAWGEKESFTVGHNKTE